jgi:electron transfer flavoprotein alpha subunit
VTEHASVLIIAELTADRLPAPITLELLGLGRMLGEKLKVRLCAVIVGSDIVKAAEEVTHYGADAVFLIDDPALAVYNPEAYLAVLMHLCEKQQPELLLLGHTSMGQDLAPRLAFALGAGLVTDCVSLEADGLGGSINFAKPIYGGNALATQRVMKSKTALATVRARVGEAPALSGEAGEIIPMGFDFPCETAMKLKGKHLEERECALEEAPVVVSGGRGMGGEEGFTKLKELADPLKGAVGSSRPPVDSGWVPSTCQVGITGKVVAPDLYIAVAISGSSQHLSGMSESGVVVAINKDPEAYIFKVSDYGVVGEWQRVLPSFTAKLNEFVGE